VEQGIPIIVSVDNTPDNYVGNNLERSFSEIQEKYDQLIWIREERNLGLAEHLVRRVRECLSTYDNLLILEDDISTSPKAILELMKLLSVELDSEFLTAGLFGAISGRVLGKVIRNHWRPTKYFSAWGWALQKESADLIDLEVIKKNDMRILEKSMVWNELSENQKERWKYRFHKVSENPRYTWDYQMQFLSFMLNKNHLLPRFRLCDNEGFADIRATNTKLPRPRWYRGKKFDQKSLEEMSVKRNFLPAYELVDSLTWIGDRKLRQ
jgi:hypothetical protein